MKEQTQGKLHPLTIVMNEMVSVFHDLGFGVCEALELDSEINNFDKLNLTPDHPARGMQDTFHIKNRPGYVLRTHTSNVEIHAMEELVRRGGMPPFALVAPGKVFRNEATDMTHEVQFFQLEGLVIGKDINVSHLVGTLDHFFKRMLGDTAKVRLRPSFFPFVEPGFEVDVWNGKKWIEVLGAGMSHPNVLRNCGIDPTVYQGFAFGMGVDRIAMMKYGFSDVRSFYNGDIRLLDSVKETYEN